MELEATEEQLDALRTEVEAIKAQIAQLEGEKAELVKHTRRLEDRQVKNWKLIHEASKFSGVSVFKWTERSCTFHFHPMWLNTSQPTYSLAIDFNDKGYTVKEAHLPEGVKIADLDNTKPLTQLVQDLSDLVTCFCNRKEQVKTVEEDFGESLDKTITYTADMLKVLLRVKVSENDTTHFMLNVELNYKPDEILPYDVALNFEDGREMTENDKEDFDAHGSHFYNQPLPVALREAF